MKIERDRVISITLTEVEWRVFVSRRPKPVDWLRARILDEVNAQLEEEPGEQSLKAKS
jgi:hypothetical protein